MRSQTWMVIPLFAFLAGCGLEDGANMEPEQPDREGNWAAVELYETAGPNGEWVAVSEAAIKADRNWIQPGEDDGWEKVLWTDQPDGSREPYRPLVPGWVQELRLENGGDWPEWFGPAERAFYGSADAGDVAAFRSGRCGNQEEPVLFMETPYSVAHISQSKRGPNRGSVAFTVGAA